MYVTIECNLLLFYWRVKTLTEVHLYEAW